jgi:hypothetical protein
MALIHALLGYRDRGLLHEFQMLGDRKAVVTGKGGRTTVVAMASEYIVSATDVREACRAPPKPDYFLFNNWDQVTSEAYKTAESLDVRIVKFGALAYALKAL